jgi:uroporphyrinogen-III synthase
MGETLERRGAVVERIHVYRRVTSELPVDAADRIVAADSLVTLGASLEAVTGLLEKLPRKAADRVRNEPLIVPSRRVAEHAARMGCRRCVEAGGASDEVMLSALERLWRD